MKPPPGSVVLRRAAPDDVDAYLDFMVRNRRYLEPWEPARGDEVFTTEWVVRRLAPDERRCGYVATRDERIIAQAMLGNFTRGAFQNATLGYAVDEQENGRGIATKLVGHVAREAFSVHGLHRIEAGTLLHNLASQRVLEKNRFQRIGVSRRHLRIAGTWQDHVLYSLTAEGT